MRVGIMGGGQLARMIALAGHPLGLEFTVLDPAVDACAGAVAHHIRAAYDDRMMLDRFADGVDIITYEFENVPAESARYLEQKRPVFPSPETLAISRDRLREKTLFRELGIPTPEFQAIDTVDQLHDAVVRIGLPAVLKSRTLGYDGKGQAVLRRAEDAHEAWARIGSVPCVLESFVPFTREISIVAARGSWGATTFFPIGENVHRDGILRISECKPADPLQSRAEQYARALLDRLEYAGVLALELFDVNGTLLANEIAPRVHNSGHWTIEGTRTSQFENHLRAILGLPLGSSAPRGLCAMVNFIGTIPPASSVLAIPNTHYHNYGKKPRPGRKLGHATVCVETRDELGRGVAGLVELARSGQ